MDHNHPNGLAPSGELHACADDKPTLADELGAGYPLTAAVRCPRETATPTAFAAGPPHHVVLERTADCGRSPESARSRNRRHQTGDDRRKIGIH